MIFVSRRASLPAVKSVVAAQPQKWNSLAVSASSTSSKRDLESKKKPTKTKSRATLALSRKLKRALTGETTKDFPSPGPRLDWGDESWEESYSPNSIHLADRSVEAPTMPIEVEEEKPSRKNVSNEVRCFDTARINVVSGNGGNGCVAFHREKFVPKGILLSNLRVQFELGGPSGGNGGRGGHVWAVADRNLNSLLGFRKRSHYRAGKGEPGKGSNLTGAQGGDAFVPVPPGTVIRFRDDPDSPPLAELFRHGDKALLAVGGKGGRGNLAFKTTRNTAPAIAENGDIYSLEIGKEYTVGAPGEDHWLELELKLVADVGIIGVPNAGKSTFLSVISAAKPKIANYPFTTLIPNLGVCDHDYHTTVFADVPGLLEGASRGHGLGHEFLRHCMRCRVLVHMVDGSSPDPIGDYEAVQLELKLFSPELSSKPQIVCYNKTDIPEVSEAWHEMRQHFLRKGVSEENLIHVSAATGHNTESVVRAVRRILQDLPVEEEEETGALNLQRPLRGVEAPKIEDYMIIVQNDVTPRLYTVKGEAIELFTAMTNWNYYEAFRRYQRVLDRSGISDALRESGISEGDDVQIGERVFAWTDDNSEKVIYETFKDMQRGKPIIGSSRWPHVV